MTIAKLTSDDKPSIKDSPLLIISVTAECVPVKVEGVLNKKETSQKIRHPATSNTDTGNVGLLIFLIDNFMCCHRFANIQK